MKKALKILGVFALTAAIGLSMAACKGGDDDYPDPPKQFLTVSGIPSTYINMYGIIILAPPNSSDITVYSGLEKIKLSDTSSISFPLYRWEQNDPWEGSESFCVKILIFENPTTDQRKYQGVTAETDITSATIITWSSFIQK